MAVTLDFNKLRDMNDSLQKKNEDEEKTTYKKVNGNVVTGTQVSLDFDRLRDMNEALQSARKIRETLAAKRADAEAKAGVTQKSTASSAPSAQSILPTTAMSKLSGSNKTATDVYTPGGTSKKATATPLKSDEADSLLPSSTGKTALSTMADRQSAAQSVLEAAKLSQDTAAKGVDTAKLAVDTSDAGALRSRIESLQNEADRLTDAASDAGSAIGVPLAQRQSQSKQYSGSADKIQGNIDTLDSQYQALTGKTAQDVNFGDWLGDVTNAGLNQFNQSLASSLDFILPTELLFGEDNDPISKLNEFYTSKKDTAESDLNATSAAMGTGWTTAGQLGESVVGSVPNAVIALISGGGSLAGNTSAALTQTAAAQGSGLGATITSSVQSLAQNPSFWVSFAQTTGPAYNEAKASGSSELEATAAALMTGLANSVVEMGGGLEGLPSELQSGSESAIREWVKSMLDEGKEEVIQGVIENLTAKMVYDEDRAWASVSDTGAVINPVRAAQEFGGGALAGGILGGAQAGLISAMNGSTDTGTDSYSGLGGESVRPVENAGNTQTVTAQEVIQDLTAQGVDAQTAQALGETIAAVANGETISGNQAAKIAQNEQALAELETLTGTTINTDAPLSQVKTAIQNAASGAETAQTVSTDTDTSEAVSTAQSDVGARIDALVRGEATAQANTQTTADVSSLGADAENAEKYLRVSGLSEQAVQAAADSYDGNTEALTDYLSEFVQVYTAAKSGQTLPATKTLSLAQRVAASEAGVRDGLVQQSENQGTIEGTGGDNNVGETVRVRQGSQRNDSTSTQGQAGTVATGTGETGTGAVQWADAGAVQRGPADGGAADLTVTGQVTTAGLGIGGGSSADTLYTVTGSTQATQTAEALAKERGLRLVLFAGGDLTISGRTGIRGYISGDRVFVRADDPDYTAEQIMRHEAGHDRIAKGEIDPAEVRARLREKYSEAEIQALGTLYAQLYSGTGLSAEEIWEEVICDSLGDMNAFSETAVSEFVEEMLGATRQAAQTQETARATENTTGPPEGKDSQGGKFSTAVESSDSEGGKFSTMVESSDSDDRFSMRLPVEETEKLLALHNLTSEDLAATLELGGLPMPSIAVVRADAGHSEYGPISLVFDKNTIDPEADSRNKVYGGDAWTPTVGDAQVEYRVNADKLLSLERKLEPLTGSVAGGVYKKSDLIQFALRGERIGDNLSRNEVVKTLNMDTKALAKLVANYTPTWAAYAASQGQTVEPVMRDGKIDPGATARNFPIEETGKGAYHDAMAWRDKIVVWLMPQMDGILEPQGDPLENIVRSMKQSGSRGVNIDDASASSFHAMATPSYSSISQIKDDTGRLKRLSNFEWTALESDIDHALISVSDELMVEHDIEERELTDILLEAARAKGEYPGYDKYDIVKTFSQYGYDITIEEAGKLQEILDAAAEMPTEYFEAKPERAVGFEEVLAAVVPDDTEAALLQSAQEAGLNVLTYEAGNDADRLEKVNSVEGARFSRRGKQAAGAVPTDTLEQARAEARALQQENDRLKERLEKAKGQVKRTTAAQRGVRSEDAKRLARSLVKEYGSQAGVQTVADSLKALGDYLVREDSYYGKAKDMAIDAAREIVENASVEDEASLGAQYEDARKFLKTVPIEIGEDWRKGGVLNRYESDRGGDGWNNLRKQYFGRLNLRRGTQTNVDAVYADLSERWPGLFPADVMNAEDQFDRIVEVRDALDPQQVNPYDYYMAEAVEALSYDIMDRMLGDEVRQNPETFADKAEKRRIRDVNRATEKGEARLERLQERKDAQISRLQEQAKAKLEMAVERERSRRDAQVQRILDRNRQVKENARARKVDSQARDKLLKTARRLKTLKTSNANRAAIDALIGDLDTVAKSMTGTTLDKLTNLRDWYDGKTMESSPTYDPDFIPDQRTKDAIARLSKRQIKDLSIDEVQELTEALLNIENEIRTEKRLIDSQYRHDIYVAGTEIIRDVENTKGSRNGLVDRFIVTETLSPEREIRRITGYKDSDPLNIATQELAEGQRAMLDFQMRAENLFSKWANDKKFTKRFSGKDAQEVSISGVNAETGERVTVKITPAMRASLWLHAMNDQNMRHVTKGGVTIPDMALYKKGKLADAYTKGVRVRLTRTDIASIAASMTAEEKSFARAASGYFNGMSQREINAVSLELKGYELAGVESYFPIRTDSAFTKADFESVKNDGTIEGMGFLKERQNAANPILLRDLDAELNQSIRMAGKYVGLAVPVRNFNKLFNTTTKETVEGSAEATANSVAAVIGSKWGAPAKSYIEKMMTDLQNPVVRQDVWGRALDKVRSAYAGSVLTLNLSVAMKQAASYPTAAAELGWTPLARAMADFGSVDLDLIAQYTPLQWYRSQGFSTQELGDMASKNRSLPKVLNWIQGVDVMTTRKLWKASEYYVRANEKGLKRGSEDYCKAVAEVYNRVIENTQPNYTTMQRPQLLRSNNALMQSLQMFKTQPFQNFNVLYDAGGNLLAKRAAYLNEGTAESKTAYKEAGKRFGWAATSQVVQLAVFAAMTAAWNALRNKPDKYEDEDGNVTLESILKGIGKDMLSGTASMVPFGSDLWEMGSSIVFGETYYGFDSVTESAIDDLFSAFTTAADSVSEVYTSITDEESEGVTLQTGWLDFDDVFGAVSKVLGIPYDNVVNLFKVGFERAAVAIEGEYLGEYHTLWLSEETGSSEYYDLLYEAYISGDSEQYQALYDRMVADGYDEDGISSRMETRMKKAAGVDSVDDLEQRYLSPTAQESYDSTMDTVTSSSLWDKADDEQQAAIEALAYELYAGTDSGAKLQEKIDGGEEYGLSEDEYLLYRLALSIVDEPTESGNLGSYTQAETEAAIRLLTGLTSQEKAYLWQSQNAGWKSENNPFG